MKYIKKIPSLVLVIIYFILTNIPCPNIWGQDLYSVSSLPFNTRDHNEFSAVPYKEGLVFCSDRLHNIFIAKLDSLGIPLLDLYYARKKEKEKWSTPELLGKELSGNFHKGPMTLGKKGTVITLHVTMPKLQEYFQQPSMEALGRKQLLLSITNPTPGLLIPA